MYPMLCVPALKQAIWGGSKLRCVLHKRVDTPTMAESWELSGHPDGLSAIGNGEFTGQTLVDVLAAHPQFAGSIAQGDERFPLLIKFIDARQDLSIQVHPTKDTADASKGQESKAEIWVVMACDEGASLYCGFNQMVSPEEFKRRALDGTVCEVLNRVPVRQGDVFHIYPGTVHAIGAGLLIAEIQQSANTTFRVYDFMRRDAQGNLRELHIDEAARVANYAVSDGKPAASICLEKTQAYVRSCLFDTPLFYTERLDLSGSAELCVDERSFDALVMLEGNAKILYQGTSTPIVKGETYFLPAGMGSYQLGGTGVLLRNRMCTPN